MNASEDQKTIQSANSSGDSPNDMSFGGPYNSSSDIECNKTSKSMELKI